MRRPPSCGALRKAARSPYGARRYTGANASVGTAPSEAAGWQLLTQGVRVRGCWSTLDTYLPGDVVRLNGSAWIASATSTGSTPPLVSTDWQLLAQGDPHPASPSSQTYVFGKKGSVTVQDANVTASSAIVIQYVNGAGAPTSVDDVPAGQFTASESSGKSFEYVVYLRRIRIEKRGPRHPWRCPASSSSVYFGARAAPAVRSRLRCDQILTRPSALCAAPSAESIAPVSEAVAIPSDPRLPHHFVVATRDPPAGSAFNDGRIDYCYRFFAVRFTAAARGAPVRAGARNGSSPTTKQAEARPSVP
jgi:hypothetical protein